MPIGIPEGIRTPVTAVKGRGPRPLDDGDMPVAGLVVRFLRSLFCKIKGKKEKGGGFSRVYDNDAGPYPALYRLKTKPNPGKTTDENEMQGVPPVGGLILRGCNL